MARTIDYKRYSEDLGNILALSDLINRYLSSGRKSRATKAPKPQNNRLLTRLLKSKYVLSGSDFGEILKIVDGKAASATRVKAAVGVSEADRVQLKNEIDALIARVGISIREENLNEADYLRKIKGNLSVRKGKILAVVHPTRTPRAKA
ncbi:MAG: hypothetical protein LBI57_03920 [Helicobacteraceae bacterium]|jgi:hypothetical protein|nr:hypothetical protein [Helicobacteraceae bacterium]